MKINEILIEKFEPKPVNFGTDYSNKKYGKMMMDTTAYTFFENNGNQYYVAFEYVGDQKINVSFGNQPEKQTELPYPREDRTKKNMPFTVFNNVLYILFDYLKNKREIEIIFGGADEKLHKIYSKALATPSVKKILDANNIEFVKNSELFGIPIFSLYKS